MKGLQERKKPSVKNGFGTTWLGCLVDALGGDWNEVWCRGDWNTPQFDGKVLRFSTMTAWSPCNETFDLVCEKFPSLRYFYQSEEPGMVEYWTNDREGKYFPDRYIADVCTDDGGIPYGILYRYVGFVRLAGENSRTACQLAAGSRCPC